MRKLIWLVDTSLDGFMSGPKGEMDWAGTDIDDELWDNVNDLLGTVDTALFGRLTYQNFEQYWPAVPGNLSSPKNEIDFSRWIDETPKYVASRTLSKLNWKNSMLLDADLAEGIRRVKEQSGKDILMFGSCDLASGLVHQDLIDQMQIRIHPVMLGVGRPLFKDRSKRQRMKLEKSRVFASGVIQLRYDVA